MSLAAEAQSALTAPLQGGLLLPCHFQQLFIEVLIVNTSATALAPLLAP